MKVSVKRIFRGFAIGSITVVCLSVFLFLGFGYTNDRRISERIDMSKLAPLQGYKRVGSLLTSGASFSIDRSDQQIIQAKESLAEKAGNFLLSKSGRFKYSSQIFLPVGQYPERIEARDAIVLPSGSTMKIELQVGEGAQEVEARFGAIGLAGRFSLAVDSAESSSSSHTARQVLNVSELPNQVNTDGLWYRLAGKFLQVDRSWDPWKWSEFKLKLGPKRTIEITCQSDGSHCLLSDVSFYTPASKQNKNVIVVLIDTLRADAVSQGNMPNLSKFAKNSINFSRNISPGNMTSPSTNAMLSCQKPSDLGAVAFSYTLSPEVREGFYSSNRQSFAEILRRANYNTAMIGNVSVLSEVVGVGVNHGFERVVSIEVDGYDTPRVTGEAIKWLETNSDSPFLLYVHYNGPHAPYRAPVADIFATYPGISAFSSLGNALRWLYQAEVRYTDRYLRNLFDGIYKLGLMQSTTVIITADHGDQMTDRQFLLNEAGPSYRGAYFDHGGTILNDEIHVPLIFKLPGDAEKSSPSKLVKDWTQTTDLGPTVLDLLNIPVPAYCSGKSLKPYLVDDQTTMKEFSESRVLGTEGFRHRGIIFENRYKYIRGYATNDRRMIMAGTWTRTSTQVFQREELYDLVSDSVEAVNLAVTDFDLLARARSIFRRFYSVGDGFELVVEAPTKAEIEVKVDPEVSILQDGKAQDQAGVFRGSGHARYILMLENWNKVLPHVKIGGSAVKIKFTSSRIPMEIDPGELPIESPGDAGILPSSSSFGAYIRRIEPNDLQVRRIVSGNPMFDKVLREWGYLNDN